MTEFPANRLLLDNSPGINLEISGHTEQKIRSFRHLTPGWHYGRGIPISETVTRIALRLNALSRYMGVLTTDAFPGVDGEILLTCYVREHYLEVLVRPDEAVSIIHEIADEVVTEVPPTRRPEPVLRQIVGEIWNGSGSYTSTISMFGDRDLPVWHSRTHLMSLAHQSSASRAWTSGALRYANTSQSFMPERPPILRSSGFSTMPSSLPTI
jgi:hypothetical protein